jgi:uracil-DNA glycosylase family 4
VTLGASAATSAESVREQAATARDIGAVATAVSRCRACPRLVAWREEVALVRRKSFADQQYWGRPVPGFGDENPAILVVGLAPAAHGGNRTGRVFTGDRSGDWLFGSMFRVGLANQPQSTALDDGLILYRTRVVAAVRCAPPANAPTPAERDSCAPWLDRELDLIRPGLRVVVALGAFAWTASLAMLQRSGEELPSPRPRFAHGAVVTLGRLTLLGCFHPSQQNTFTGRLTPDMIDDVLGRAATIANV